MTAEKGLVKFTAYIESGIFVLGSDPHTGEPITYPIDKVKGLAYTAKTTGRHETGDTGPESLQRRELVLPLEVGSRIMTVMQQRRLLNCHGFANAIDGNDYGNAAVGSIRADHRTDSLAPGEIG